MSANIQNRNFGKPVGLLICVALVCGITGITA